MLFSMFRRLRLPAPQDRDRLAQYLSGEGIELGAQSRPLDLSGNPRVTRVRYVDRYPKAEHLALFPELADLRDAIVETDITCDVVHGLAPIADRSQDFVIACHIVEHVPDPIHFIAECRRVLRDGGILFLAAPHGPSGSDHLRPITPLAHVIDDHRRGERTVEDHHLEEYLRLSEAVEIPADAAARRDLFERHRSRSIHLHVWDGPGFAEFIDHCVRTSAPFELVDAVGPHATARREMIVILRRATRRPASFKRALRERLALAAGP